VSDDRDLHFELAQTILAAPISTGLCLRDPLRRGRLATVTDAGPPRRLGPLIDEEGPVHRARALPRLVAATALSAVLV
jgi:hypothetical protein